MPLRISGMRAIAVVLLLLPLTAVAQELPLPPGALGPSFVTDRPSATATNGSILVAVWTELAAGRTYEVRATRIDATGRPLDVPAIFLGPYDGWRSPRVAWNGSSFDIVWTDDFRVYDAQLAADGTLLRAREMVTDGRVLDAASGDGSTVMLVARERLLIACELRNGRIVRENVILVADDVFGARMTRTDSGFAVVAELNFAAVALRLDRRGVLLRQTPLPKPPLPPPFSGGIRITSIGDAAFIVRTEYPDVHLYRFDAYGSLNDEATFSEKLDADIDDFRAAPDGSFAFTSHNQIGHVAPNGRVLDRRELQQYPSWAKLSIEFIGGRPWLTANGYRYEGRFLDREDAPVTIAWSPQSQFGPAAAAAGDRVLIVWNEARRPPAQHVVRGVLTRADGVPLGAPFDIDMVDAVEPPQVIYDGTSFIVAGPHKHGQTLYVARVSTSGVVDDVQTFPSFGGEVRLATDGSRTLVDFADGCDARLLDAAARCTPAAPMYGWWKAAAVWVGNAWVELLFGSSGDVDLVTLDRDATREQLLPFLSIYSTHAQAAIASNGHGAFALFEPSRRLLGFAVDDSGAPGAVHLLSPDVVSNASIVWDGAAYTITAFDDTSALRAIRVDADGQTVTPWTTIAERGVSSDRALVPTGNGRLLAVYSRDGQLFVRTIDVTARAASR